MKGEYDMIRDMCIDRSHSMIVPILARSALIRIVPLADNGKWRREKGEWRTENGDGESPKTELVTPKDQSTLVLVHTRAILEAARCYSTINYRTIP